MKCYQCEYRREVPGDAHSQCVHPVTKNLRGGLGAILGMLSPAFGGGLISITPEVRAAGHKIGLKANIHGIEGGWFRWPYNFDPTWLVDCKGFTKRG